MQKLNGLDEMFLAYETVTTTCNMGGLSILQPGSDPASGRLEAMRERIADRLDYLPVFRWRLTPNLLVGNRFWWEHGPVDLDQHVLGVSLPAPGTDEQLADLVSKLCRIPLERDRPMWRFYVIEGLQGGRLAHLLKLSHGLADGTAQARVIDILSDHPMQGLVHDPPPPQPEPANGYLELIGRAAGDLATTPVRAANVMWQLGGWLTGRVKEEGLAGIPAAVARSLPGEYARPAAALANRARSSKQASPVGPGIPTLFPPRSAFNARLSGDFQFRFTELPLEDFRRAGKAAGGTINDAVLAVCAGAVRRYLQAHGGLPDKPLISCSPISFRTGAEKQPWANHMYALFVPIPTHLEDPIDRLHWAHRSATAAKDNWQAGIGPITRPVMGFMPWQPMAIGMEVIARSPDRAPGLPFNLPLSNVKGSKVTQRFAGAESLGFWPVPFMMPGVGIMLVFQSYKHRLNLGISVDKRVVPDLEFLLPLIADSLSELLHAQQLTEDTPTPGPAPVQVRPARTPTKRTRAAKPEGSVSAPPPSPRSNGKQPGQSRTQKPARPPATRSRQRPALNATAAPAADVRG